jgi:hypothetical protein
VATPTAIPTLDVDRSSPAQDFPTPVTGDVDSNYVIEDNLGNVFIYVENATDNDQNVTILPQASGPAGTPLAETTILVAAHTKGLIGPFPPAIFNDDSNTVFLGDDSVGGALSYTGLRY